MSAYPWRATFKIQIFAEKAGQKDNNSVLWYVVIKKERIIDHFTHKSEELMHFGLGDPFQSIWTQPSL